MSLAHTLGKEVVAEGVERPGQLHRLRALGCDYVQGFYLLPPQDDLVTHVARRVDDGGDAEPLHGSRGLSITFGRESGFVVLRLSGNIDRSTSAELRERLSDVIDEQGNLSVMLDLAGVRVIDRNGAQVLGAAYDRLHVKGGSLALARPGTTVHQMLVRFGLADLVRAPAE
jgi:anti-anti-sigma factor